MKILTSDKIKKLPVGTDVHLVQESTGRKGTFWITKSGRKKVLRGVYGNREIKDRPGWHYEVEEQTGGSDDVIRQKKLSSKNAKHHQRAKSPHGLDL